MYGYNVSIGYRGLVNGRWMIFATEAEYSEYLRDFDERDGLSNEIESNRYQ